MKKIISCKKAAADIVAAKLSVSAAIADLVNAKVAVKAAYGKVIESSAALLAAKENIAYGAAAKSSKNNAGLAAYYAGIKLAKSDLDDANFDYQMAKKLVKIAEKALAAAKASVIEAEAVYAAIIAAVKAFLKDEMAARKAAKAAPAVRNSRKNSRSVAMKVAAKRAARRLASVRKAAARRSAATIVPAVEVAPISSKIERSAQSMGAAKMAGAKVMTSGEFSDIKAAELVIADDKYIQKLIKREAHFIRSNPIDVIVKERCKDKEKLVFSALKQLADAAKAGATVEDIKSVDASGKLAKAIDEAEKEPKAETFTAAVNAVERKIRAHILSTNRKCASEQRHLVADAKAILAEDPKDVETSTVSPWSVKYQAPFSVLHYAVAHDVAELGREELLTAVAVYKGRIESATSVKPLGLLRKQIMKDKVLGVVVRRNLLNAVKAAWAKFDVSEELGMKIVSFEDAGMVLARKETVNIASVRVIAPGMKPSKHDAQVFEHAGLLTKKGLTKAGYVHTSDEYTLSKYLICGEKFFGKAKKKTFWYNNHKGLFSGISERHLDWLLQIDCGRYEESVDSDFKTRISRLLYSRVIIKITKDMRKAPEYYFYNDIAGDCGFYKIGTDETEIGLTSCKLAEAELEKLDSENKVEWFVFANRSTSSARQGKVLMIRVDREWNPDYAEFKDLVINGLAKQDLLEEFLDDVTDGGFKMQLKDFQKFVDRAKFVKRLERDILELTDAKVYDGDAALKSFGVLSGKFKWVDQETGKLVAAYDGAWFLALHIAVAQYVQTFGHAPLDVEEIIGRMEQARCCYLKGIGCVYGYAERYELALSLLQGKLTGSKIPELEVISSDSEMAKVNLHSDRFVFRLFGEQFAGVDISKMSLEEKADLIAQCDAIGDENAFKDYWKMATGKHTLSLLSFPPLWKDKVHTSNQISFSFLFNAVVKIKNGETLDGKELFFALFKAQVEKKLAKMVQSKGKLSFADLQNVNAFIGDLILAINYPTYWADNYLRNDGMVQLCQSINKSIDHIGFECEGFNAVGDVDPLLAIAGIHLFGADEMYSGNATYRQLVAVFRHPKAGESEFALLYDVSPAEALNRLRTLYAAGKITKGQYKACWNRIKNIGGRHAIFPATASFANSTGGSDRDGDSFTVVTDRIIVKSLTTDKIVRRAIDYGETPKDGIKCRWAWDYVGDILDDDNVSNFDTVYFQFKEDSNLDVGLVVPFLARILSIKCAILNDRMPDEDIVFLLDLFKKHPDEENLKYVEDEKVKYFSISYKDFFNRNSKKQAYERYFFLDEEEYSNKEVLCELIDGATIANWMIDNKNYVVKDRDSLLAWCEDMEFVLSSCIGRTVDAAKNGETVVVPYYAVSSNVYSAFCKGQPGKTSVVLEYSAPLHDEEGHLVDDDVFDCQTLKHGPITVVVGGKEIKYYIPECNALQLKNECVEWAANRLNEFCGEIDKIVEENSLFSMEDELKSVPEGIKKSSSVKLPDFIDQVGAINSGILMSRPEKAKDLKKFTIGTLRHVLSEKSEYDGIEYSWQDTLSLAMLGSQRSWKISSRKMDNFCYDEQDLSNEYVDYECDSDTADIEAESEYIKVSDKTRYYLIPEMARRACEERLRREAFDAGIDFDEEWDAYVEWANDHKLEIIDEISSTSEYVFKTGEKLFFVNGVADLPDGGKAICDHLGGKEGAEFEVLCKNGIPYVFAYAEDFIDKVIQSTGDFIVSCLSAHAPNTGDDVEGTITWINQRFLEDPDVNEKYDFISVSNSADGDYLICVDKETWEWESVATVSVPGFSYAKRRAGIDDYCECLNFAKWQIKDAVVYANSKGKHFGCIALNFVEYISDEYIDELDLCKETLKAEYKRDPFEEEEE